MLRISEIKLPLDHDDTALEQAIIKKLGIGANELTSYSIFKRSYDARKRGNILLVYIVDVATPLEEKLLVKFTGDRQIIPTPTMAYQFVAQVKPGQAVEGERPIVIGTGPCGMFAGLLLAQMGLKPIILERGKSVRDRSVDTFGFWVKGKLNPESNVQFGEGGAGTFSDGKLYSQVRDPNHYGRKVLEEFVKAGANPEILYINKPHIGTYRLVKIVQNLRSTIETLGGEIRFQNHVTDININQGQVEGVTLENGEYIASRHVVLAVGHSARDTFQMLFDRGVYIEAKPFSIGFRIEHPQAIIDQCRFGKQAGHPRLGSADYKLVHHCQNGRSVYSFCMCPGGKVVAAASEPGRLVTNGMSEYARDEANGDFLNNRPSTKFGIVKPSYKPGIKLVNLGESLPNYAIAALREAIPAFDKKIRGFAMDDAVLTGVETRTSSPIRIKRGPDFQSINTVGLYPAGEGAGYAGGILSAGIDGIKVAEALALSLTDGR